ncbi:biopolymer transport protein ExbD [Parabacteroides sp. PF5-5]|uniref:biopolymer transporter ExbD n=1 Tax=unclassified Parabacteroides TaxID=2649774 RepID=UPI002474F016|nr:MULTISPECIES: biopolymer transporter ExbD [unclassified Parabacteroides]MDH6303476.1 biopolymer transport protein ExbD [Parabacteroides sp. PH5-39]MDH6314798.1 biopolymer transport protein ExbD [Parabacteroides sp. PF5-13]MDH6318135.1 biopolymer transport protein ExbD [Parabacteroides sp. PH5-13]MDH6321933.1 biopolymer transport protein ExbD [Parabacteroides sp. PH5-8]MDH6326057.1 biopolymer transport protein ExbD [Parabacteroides sp. PH5-41]
MARKKRKAPSINATSSADIAFMLLLFFLLTSSMDTDRGLPRRLPPPVPKDQKKSDVDIKKRNLMVVLINSSNQVAINGEYTEIRQIKDKVKEFIENPYNDEHKPEKVPVDVPFFGEMMVSKNHVISLQNDRGTEYQAYINVQNELAAAYNELRDDVSRKKFGKAFADLDEDRQRAVQDIYPQKISEAEPKNYGGNK